MNLVLALQILTALVMIGLVLIQHGKGADMGASFGSGASGSLFGATGSANFLSRSTAVCAAVFFVCTLALAYTVERPAAGRRPAACSTGRRRARRRTGADGARAPARDPRRRASGAGRSRRAPAPVAGAERRLSRASGRRLRFRRSRGACSARIRRLPGEPFLMPAEQQNSSAADVVKLVDTLS